MSVQIVSSPVKVRQAVAGALDGWRWDRCSWGTKWEFVDDLGGAYYVAHNESRGELEVHMPGGMGYDAFEATIGFDPDLPGVDFVTTPGGVAELLTTLGLPEVDQ